jgi:hypothetical protein
MEVVDFVPSQDAIVFDIMGRDVPKKKKLKEFGTSNSLIWLFC